MGRVKKGEKCSVEDCIEQALHSVSYVEAKDIEEHGLKLRSILGRVYLCEKHYKLYKKVRRRKEKLEKWRLRG